jgi:DNA-binding CsgD family transcriptional regulator
MRSSQQRDCHTGCIQLTERELAVLRLVAAGRTNAQIAGELYLSHQSVGRCISMLMLRTLADNRAELVARAYVEGVLDHGTWPPKLAGENQLSTGARSSVGPDAEAQPVLRRVTPMPGSAVSPVA